MITNNVNNNFNSYTSIAPKKKFKDKVVDYALKEPIKTAEITVGSFLLLTIALVKRKSIAKFVKNLFNKKSNNNISSNVTTNKTNNINNGIDDLKKGTDNIADDLSSNVLNLDKLKKEYLYIDPDKFPDKAVIGLKELQKSGTRNDLLELRNYYYHISKNNDVMQEYAKLVAKVGKIEDCLSLRGALNLNKTSDVYNEKTYEEIVKALKTVFEKEEASYSFANYSYAGYKKFDELCERFPDNPSINECSTVIKNLIIRDNPAYK